MSDGMGRELAYLSLHATNRYFIPNWGIIMLFGMSMQVLAQANDAHEGETGAATIVSLVASLVALIGTFVTY